VGSQTVTVTVTNKKGSAVGVHALTLYAPPVAGFGAAPTAGVAPLEVAFSNTSTGYYTAAEAWPASPITGTELLLPGVQRRLHLDGTVDWSELVVQNAGEVTATVE
jgi:hypothetical protein